MRHILERMTKESRSVGLEMNLSNTEVKIGATFFHKGEIENITNIMLYWAESWTKKVANKRHRNISAIATRNWRDRKSVV